ncbi:MAG: hypothetical protein KBB94_10265 [Legionellaceae bacterium]|nr:hypothetical protein [Legionellaceae bacterium]MBP9776073.1 hypothetical protein [Legionellaceae bacterium]
MNGSIKGVLACCLLAFGSASFAACPSAAPITSAQFCQSFKAATECHCVFSGLRGGICTNMNQFYIKMINTLGTLPRVCSLQRYTATQECIDDWNCYRYGGLTSDGQLCSGTGHACD